MRPLVRVICEAVVIPVVVATRLTFGVLVVCGFVPGEVKRTVGGVPRVAVPGFGVGRTVAGL